MPPASTNANNPIINVVSMNYRYISAWNEINTRIALRQNAVALYVTLSGGVITLLSLKPEIGLEIEFVTFLLPCVAIACTLLYRMHDETIAVLRNFLEKCETLHTDQYPGLTLIGYNSSDEHIGKADGIKKLHDWTFLSLVVLFNGLGIYVIWKVSPNDQSHVFLMAVGVIAAIAPFIILKWQKTNGKSE